MGTNYTSVNTFMTKIVNIFSYISSKNLIFGYIFFNIYLKIYVKN